MSTDHILRHEFDRFSLHLDQAFGGFRLKSKIETASLDGTFDSFGVYNEGQAPVIDTLKRLAAQLVERDRQILADEQAWKEGKVLAIYGQPGRGKTHLLNALINHIKENAPTLIGRVEYLVGKEFSDKFFDEDLGDEGEEIDDPFEDDKILFLDDVFRDYEGVLTVNQLPELAVARFQRFIRGVYEHKQLVVMTSNFRILEAMHARVIEFDKVGRDSSRFAAVRGASKELLLPGKDYRVQTATKRLADDDEFAI